MRVRGHRGFAGHLTLIVMGLHAAVVAAFVLDPADPPRRGSFWQALWALDHQASFIPLIGLLLLAPPATWLAWSIRGEHRRWLVAAWLVFGSIATVWFAHRIYVMTQLVWQHGL